MPWIISVLTAALLVPGMAAGASPLLERLTAASRDVRYQPPSLEEFTQAQELFYRLLVHRDPLPCTELASLGFQLQKIDVKNGHWLLIEDMRKRGAGFYVVRRAEHGRSAWPLLLQAPHSFYDRGTRQLAVLWMHEGRFAAAAWNTAHRHQLENNGADMAHQDISFFQAFTLAFARAHPTGGVIQLHGYSKEKRKDRQAAEADVILSNGTTKPSRMIQRIDRCLDRLLVGTSRVYPLEVRELGATTNRNALALRAKGFEGFVHIEMSENLRRKLIDVWFLRNRFLQCVREGWG